MNDVRGQDRQGIVSTRIRLGRLHLNVHPSAFGLSAMLVITVVFATLLNLDR